MLTFFVVNDINSYGIKKNSLFNNNITKKVETRNIKNINIFITHPSHKAKKVKWSV